MGRTIITLIFFSIWSIADLCSMRILFDRFLILGKERRHRYRYIWLLYYFAVTYIYCMAKLYSVPILAAIFFFLFYFRAVPLLWSGYGVGTKIPAIFFFYEEAEAVISSTFTLIMVFIAGIKVYDHRWIDDIVAAVTAVIFAVLLSVVASLRENRLFSIGLGNLSTWKYIFLAAAVFFTGNLESSVWYADEGSGRRLFSILVMILVLILTGMVIFINRNNYTLENVIGIMNRQMKNLTEYYHELNLKDDGIRHFRHDMKNHLLAIRSMLDNEDISGAEKYIDSLDSRFHISERRFHTGNVLVDALLETKSEGLSQKNVTITFDGIIPGEGIDDVDMVILVSNMVDNAIEACEDIRVPARITIESRFRKGMWAFTVKNPTSVPVRISGNYISTTKADPELHGIGIGNMQRVVKKYDGTIILSAKEGVFEAVAGLEIG